VRASCTPATPSATTRTTKSPLRYEKARICGLFCVWLANSASCGLLPPGQDIQRLFGIVATYLRIGHEARADCRPIRRVKDIAAPIRGQVDTSHTRRLALGHAGDG